MRQDYQRFTPEKIENLSKLLPQEEDIPGIFVQLQKLAEQNNFVLGNIDITPALKEPTPGTPAPETDAGQEEEPSRPNHQPDGTVAIPKGVHELSVSFVIAGGDYDNLKSFLTDLEHNIRLFDIYDISFGAVTEGPYTINMRTYYLVQ